MADASYTAQGDLTVKADVITGSFRATGTLTLEGRIEATSIYGHRVVLISSEVSARAISAAESITIGEAKLKADVILAPTIDIDPKASGRVKVIEARNDMAPTKVRGAYTLAEYEEDFGDSIGFLKERGVTPFGDGAAFADDVTDHGVAAGPAHEESIDDPLSLDMADLIPVTDEDDPLHAKLADALSKIMSSYTDELPPPVETLQSLVAARDYDALRGAITTVWTGLLGYHQDKGIRPHHQVTHAFNVIHGLVTQP